jgi:S-disulfanyl-L-cysteine oxidoreductase SoxD
MHMRNIVILMLGGIFCLTGTPVLAGGPNLGKSIEPSDIAPWDISIGPEGAGLPKGNGAAAQGATIFEEKCALCHGEHGKGGHSIALVRDDRITDISASMKSIPNFWPYATTLFDYIRRAMPWHMPRSLTGEEAYALTAYILAENKVIAPSEPMNAETLPKVKMQNREGFIDRFPEKMR